MPIGYLPAGERRTIFRVRSTESVEQQQQKMVDTFLIFSSETRLIFKDPPRVYCWCRVGNCCKRQPLIARDPAGAVVVGLDERAKLACKILRACRVYGKSGTVSKHYSRVRCAAACEVLRIAGILSIIAMAQRNIIFSSIELHNKKHTMGRKALITCLFVDNRRNISTVFLDSTKRTPPCHWIELCRRLRQL